MTRSPVQRRAQSGSVLMEAVLFIPIVMALLIGTVELAKVTYTYHSLQKVMYSLARYASTQQGVNFCDENDATLLAAKNFALTGQTDSAENPSVVGLRPDMFQIRIERIDPATQQINICDCSPTGCDASQGGLPPDFIVVSMINGYSVRPVFLGFSIDPFALRPSVRLPYGGT